VESAACRGGPQTDQGGFRLHDALAAGHGARVVSVSSSGNLFSPVVFDDLHFDFRPYDPLVAYGQSKTADALLAVEATRRWSGEGIYANALNPAAPALWGIRYWLSRNSLTGSGRLTMRTSPT
jgi:NAD(P)-dependent dehydrogenase (short-subunit alcohol dehydrogenase family)